MKTIAVLFFLKFLFIGPACGRYDYKHDICTNVFGVSLLVNMYYLFHSQ